MDGEGEDDDSDRRRGEDNRSDIKVGRSEKGRKKRGRVKRVENTVMDESARSSLIVFLN